MISYLLNIGALSIKLYYFNFFIKSGSHLLSQVVSNQVPSAVYALTIVFGMGTGVTHRRIATEMTRKGIEPLLPPWKGDVLTAWPTGLISQFYMQFF